MGIADEPPVLGPSPSGQKIALRPRLGIGHLRQVQAILEARGDLKLKAAEDKTQRLEMEVRGTLQFAERVLDDDGSHSVRHYAEADAKIRIGQGGATPQLREDRRLVIAKKRERMQYRAASGPMERAELDLLRAQGDPLVLPELLPADLVAVGDSWSVGAANWTRLLALDAVTKAEVPIRFSNLEGAIALLDFEGSVDGAIGGVATEIDLKGKVNFDTRRGELTWLAMTVKEKRSIGAAMPGVEALSRLRVAIRPLGQSAELSDNSLAEVPLEIEATNPALRLHCKKIGITMVHDPRWTLMIDRPDVTILRFVDDNTVVAQCNISRLTPRPPNKPFTRNAFLTDIQKTLDRSFVQFIESSEDVTDSGLTVLRAVATGVIQDVSIQWIYYHLANAKGERVSLVFMMDAQFVEAFAGQDSSLAGTVEILPAPQPEPATSGSDPRGEE